MRAVWARQVGGVLLTLAAVVGALCLLAVLAGVVAGVQPLVFRSGSMSPAITAGSLGVTRQVPVADLEVGDVVTVHEGGVRVTHRIVDLTRDGDRATLRLRGDANNADDARPVVVTGHADRIWFSLPGLGTAIAWFSRAPGVFVLAGYAVLLLLLVRPGPGSDDRPRRHGGHRRRGGRRSARTVGVGAGVLMIGVCTIGSAAARWSDTGSVADVTMATGAASSPVALGTSANCVASNGLTSSTITFSWTGITPGTGQSVDQYEYLLTFDNRSTGTTVTTQTVSHSGAAGSTQSVTYGGTLLGNLLGLDLLSAQTLQVQIQAHLVGSTYWYGATTVSINFSTRAVLTIPSFTCNA
ncbi:MAG: signal peptidase I [Nocardioides sp.]|uniref:signal peptidase I n=1 Tax=Nocardioides sp. TaxID=35761 RepID=UPI0039E6F1D7